MWHTYVYETAMRVDYQVVILRSIILQSMRERDFIASKLVWRTELRADEVAPRCAGCERITNT